MILDKDTRASRRHFSLTQIVHLATAQLVAHFLSLLSSDHTLDSVG